MDVPLVTRYLVLLHSIDLGFVIFVVPPIDLDFVIPVFVAMGVDLLGEVAMVDNCPPRLFLGSIPRGEPVKPAFPNPGGNYDDELYFRV
jgi:hypothetical protein